MKENPELKALGQRIRELRKAKGFSQEEFAHVTGLERSYYGRIERGEINVTSRNLLRIAKALGEPVGSLFSAN